MKDRCSACPGKHQCIPGDGPTTNPLMFISARPGLKDIDRPWTGRAGREFNDNYLLLAGTCRSDIYITNAIKCAGDSNRKISQEELLTCSSHHLPSEIYECQPEIVVLMGAEPCSLSPEIDLTIHHGILQRGMLLGELRWIYPVNNPAAGLHDGKLMIPLLEDFRELRRVINQGSNAPINKHPYPTYTELNSAWDVECVLRNENTLALHCGMDTETVDNKAWCLTFSVEPGTGFMVHRDSREALQALNYHLHAQRRHIVVHHGLYARDVEFMQNLNVDISDLYVTDTAHEAYHLGNMSQGLKPIGYRILGVRMKDYEDLVFPYSRAKVLEWYGEALVIADSEPKVKEKQIISKARKFLDAPTTVWRDGIPYKQELSNSELFTAINRMMTHTEKPPSLEGKRYSPWKAWEEWDENDDGDKIEYRTEMKYSIERRIGPMPVASLEQVPREEAKNYACLHVSSKIQTNKGLVPIGEIVNKKMKLRVLSYNESTGLLEYKPITKWFRNDHTEPIRWMSVTTEQTRNRETTTTTGGIWSTRYTPDHQLLTTKGWKQVKDLTATDYLYLPVYALDEVQKQVTYGSILGDGQLARRNEQGWASLVISHCERQHPYLDWKKKLLGSLCPAETIKENAGKRTQVIIGGRITTRSAFNRIYSVYHPELAALHNESYPDNRFKHVGSWVNKLTELGLAIWYQDDGSIVGTDDRRTARLYTNSFPKKEIRLLREMLSDRFGIITTELEMRRGQWAIATALESSNAFFEMVAPFIHPCLRYKLPAGWRGKFKEHSPKCVPPGLFASKVKAVFDSHKSAKRGSVMTSYCLEVQGNHNFLTQYEVAHNCEDARVTHEAWPILRDRADRFGRDIYIGHYDA